MFYFAIPSYKRLDNQLTLQYLKKLGYNKEQIVISTQTEEDYTKYTEKYGNEATIIFKQGNCVGDNRNTLLKHFNSGEHIVMLDDHTKALQYLDKDNKLRDYETKEELDKFINNAFDYCRKNNAVMWGIYPVYNAYFMSKKIDKCNIIIATCMGIIVNERYLFDREYKTKEDFELCCRIINDGKNVARFNFVVANTTHRNLSGGCKEVWDSGVNTISYNNLLKKYPILLAPNTRRVGEVRYIGRKR